MISKPVKAEAMDNYSIFIAFEDGTEGRISLSHLAGKGVFELWNNYENFRNIYIDKETDAIAWNHDVEIDPTSLYLKLKGKTIEEWKKENLTHASNK